MTVGFLLRLCSVIVGTIQIVFTCLTWNVESNALLLICRANNFVQQLSFIDTSGVLQSTCTFQNRVPTCVSYRRDGSISDDREKMTITFTINNINNNINSKWTCVQGFSKYSTTVSLSKGIIAATEVHLVGRVIGKYKITLSCLSCREPHGNYVEFFINGFSVDGLTYDHLSKECLQRYGECMHDECSCSVSGNEFSRTFSIGDDTQVQNVSCEMRFVDPIQRYRFLQLATLYFNGEYIINKSLETHLTKAAERRHGPIYNGIKDKLESNTDYGLTSRMREVSTEITDTTIARYTVSRGDINPRRRTDMYIYDNRSTYTIFKDVKKSRSNKTEKTTHLPELIKTKIIERESTVDKSMITTTTVFRNQLNNEFNETDLNNKENIYYGLLGAGIVLVLIFFVTLNAWVSRKCRQSETLIPTQDIQQVQQLALNINNGSTNHDADCNYAHYETIKESDMIQFLNQNGLNDIDYKEEGSSSNSETDIYTQDSDANSKGSPSCSDRSYLEVIGDDHAPYTTVHSDSDPCDVHDYSEPLAENVLPVENNNTKIVCSVEHSRSKSI